PSALRSPPPRLPRPPARPKRPDSPPSRPARTPRSAPSAPSARRPSRSSSASRTSGPPSKPAPAGNSRVFAGSAALTRNRHGPQSVEVSDEAQATESGEQPPGLGFLVAVFEVLRPEIAIRGAVLQHVVDGSED